MTKKRSAATTTARTIIRTIWTVFIIDSSAKKTEKLCFLNLKPIGFFDV